ncbi:MAG TPA: protein kinase [Thermoanaerobaculia bacterium]|nr:protein kinase [Thermoanaerobaculia bacterium]
MTLSPRTRLGPYELLELLGAGGMGEIYRARDTRLQREVAVKVLAVRLSSDPARLKRFEREARSASALNHPNIVTIYEIGQADSTSYIAMELVDGKTLRELLHAGPLPLRKLLSIAGQVADGLAKAHASGIVHRDLKPENVMVTSDGLVKILDFGLAKLTHPGSDLGESEPVPTIDGGTEPGLVMGTVGYMSPEQATGQPLDFRSDQFSFGSILYEMTTGKTAFDRLTKPETLAAIIREEPEPVAALNPGTPSYLSWIVERCLAKEPRDRYAATEDLARELATLREHVTDLSGANRVAFESPRRRARWRTIGRMAALLAVVTGVYVIGQRVGQSRNSQPRFRQLTFRGAGISTARFAPDGQTVVYAAESEGKPPELFTARLDSPETRSLGLPSAEILSISSSGQMALLLAPRFSPLFRAPHSDISVDPSRLRGILAEASLAGGTPRELLEDVYFAEWSPDGKSLAVVRYVGGKNRIEFPQGKVLYEVGGPTYGRISLSPSGDRVAFAAFRNLYVIESGGQVRNLRERAMEIAWHRPTNEIWFNSVARGTTELFAITPGRPKRLVTTMPGDFILHDISADGRVLLGRLSEASEILGDFPGEAHPRNLSHLDRSIAADLSSSGDTLLLSEIGQSDRSVYLRQTDGSPPKRLGEGLARALSPDGKSVIAVTGLPDPQIFVIPTGPGQSRQIETPGLRPGGRMGFFPDSRRIWFLAENASHERRVWMEDLGGGKPRAMTPPDVGGVLLSGDGRFLSARAVDGDWHVYSTQTTETHKILGLFPDDEPIQWTADGKFIYVRSADAVRPGDLATNTRVYRLDPWTGRRELWKEIRTANPSSGGGIGTIFFSADGKICVYTHHRYSSELFLIDGLK